MAGRKWCTREACTVTTINFSSFFFSTTSYVIFIISFFFFFFFGFLISTASFKSRT